MERKTNDSINVVGTFNEKIGIVMGIDKAFACRIYDNNQYLL